MRCYRLPAALALVFILVGSGYAKVMPVKFDPARNRLIEFMLSAQLPAQHFSHKTLKDVSRAAFDLYLRQLDPRKRFLLKEDVQQLKSVAGHLTDKLRRGRVVLPDTGAALLNKRVHEVQAMLKRLMEAGFDPNREDYIEIDPKKIEYAANAAELQDRWRCILKMQVLETYFDLQEQEKKKKDNGEATGLRFKSNRVSGETVNRTLWTKAMDKVGERTRLYLHRLLQETRQEHYDRYFDAIARAFGPHTSYMAPTSKEDFDIHMSGSLEGIGALLREDGGHIKVVRIIPGSAAERQGGLQAEDIILAVAEKGGDPVDITDMRIRQAVSYIRGPKGSEVRLTVQKPSGVKQVITIIRDVVRIEETYVKSTVLGSERGNPIGYIRIPSFYRDFDSGKKGKSARNVTDDMRRALYKLKKRKIKGLILDVRNNGGGSLSDAVDISGLFLPGGPVVQIKNSQGMVRLLEDEDKNVVYDGPLIVLVNRFSASASEILAAALQDYGRALIIGGEHTHGKGTVQALLDLNRNLPILHLKKYDDLGVLKVTIQKFYRINGGSTQYKGIRPDVILPSVLDSLKSGEKYLDYSLPWDQVRAVKYQRWQGSRLDVAEARRFSAKMVASSPLFKKIKEEAALAKARSEETRVPDYLAGIRKERQKLAAESDDHNGHSLLWKTLREGELPDKKEKKALQSQLAKDPYVQMAVSLMDDLRRSPRRVIGDAR